jgi:hypothetical protein
LASAIFTALNAGSLSGGGGDRRGAILAVPLERGIASEGSAGAGPGIGSEVDVVASASVVDVDVEAASEEPDGLGSADVEAEHPAAITRAAKATTTT